MEFLNLAFHCRIQKNRKNFIGSGQPFSLGIGFPKFGKDKLPKLRLFRPNLT
ncbi:hypothetical protein LEP1GSC040_2841 [Leptospira santarosai str. 2000030832]|uniref:Uncharacterized protein n=1 Tax=Leptospira santarosai serovar Arenal str. MAVJ 401 TaxID=1049976 RepID=M6JJZ9_9LEPT|nr:hypothetical protein LEP1GSC040_2841 [Leptospira santarosai str. 2000030832]EMN19953.1 hypothetical protein LEP1GSC063_2030 [Leptospira santarosai serovar Arenal str. MAVJ 401]